MQVSKGSPEHSDDVVKTKVFVSYSRRNSDFAEKLHQTLEVVGYDILIDRADIAAGEDWKARLNALIVAADTVIFVVSPASVESQICGWEVAEARRLGKRILPVVVQKTNEALLPEDLRRLHFVYFAGRKFNGALEQLCKALKQDLTWLREHTRLGDLALQWNGQLSGILRGKALEAAEHWIASPPRDAGVATDLQRQFIKASRKAATSRQRNWVIGISAVALFSVGLTIWSEINRRETVAQTAIAEAQTKLANDRKVEADDRRIEAEKQKKRAAAAVEAAAAAANDMVFELAQRFENSSGVPVLLIKEILERARNLQKKLAESGETSTSVKQGSADALSMLSKTYQNLGQLSEAETAALESFSIRETLFREHPSDKAMMRDLGLSHFVIGNVRRAQGKLDDALKSYRDNLSIILLEIKQNGQDILAKHDLAVAYQKIGDVLSDLGDLVGAKDNFQKSLEIDLEQVATDSNDLKAQRNLSVAYIKLGDIFQQQGNFSSALKNFGKSLEIHKTLLMNDHQNKQAKRDLSVSYERVGFALSTMGNLVGALENYRLRLAISESLAQDDKSDAVAQRDLGTSYNNIAEILSEQGDTKGAIDYFLKNLTISEFIAKKDVSNIEAQRDLGLSYWSLASAGEAPRENFGKALAIFTTLKAQGKLQPADIENIQELEKLIADLE